MKIRKYFNSSELNKLYISRKQVQLREMEKRKVSLEILVNSEKKRLEENQKKHDQMELRKNILLDKYNSLKRVIKERGFVIDINNNNYQIKDWDNLILSKFNRGYSLLSKKGEELLSFNSHMNKLLEEFSREKYSFSAVAVRVDPGVIKVNVRIIDRVWE